MGADRGIHVEVPLDTMLSVQPIHVSKILAELAKKEVYTIQLYIILNTTRTSQDMAKTLDQNSGTQITLRGWIFWTISCYDLKNITSI